jgi:hypothetical protein
MEFEPRVAVRGNAQTDGTVTVLRHDAWFGCTAVAEAEDGARCGKRVRGRVRLGDREWGYDSCGWVVYPMVIRWSMECEF